MKEYESETKDFLYSNFLQQKQLLTKYKHAFQDTVDYSHHEVGNL